MFLLAETYFRSLKPDIQTDMLQHEFEIPKANRSSTKSRQIDALNGVRTKNTEAHERSFISHKAISLQVKQYMTSTGRMYQQSTTNHVGLGQGTNGYEALANDASSDILTDDDINTYSFDPDAFGIRGDNDNASLYNYS